MCVCVWVYVCGCVGVSVYMVYEYGQFSLCLKVTTHLFPFLLPSLTLEYHGMGRQWIKLVRNTVYVKQRVTSIVMFRQ